MESTNVSVLDQQENERKQTFQDELLSKCKNVLKYSGRDIIECEITVTPNVHLVNWHPNKFIRGGKQVIDIEGNMIAEVLKDVATEYDVQQLQLIDMDIGKRRKIYFKSLQEQMNRQEGMTNDGMPRVVLKESDVEDKMTFWTSENNKYKEFLAKFGYPMPAIRHFKMIVNKGPAPTDIQAKDDRDKDLYSAMLEQNKAMMELIKNLTAKK